MKNDSMGSIVQSLGILYEERGRTTSWTVRDDFAHGNPLINSKAIQNLR